MAKLTENLTIKVSLDFSPMLASFDAAIEMMEDARAAIALKLAELEGGGD